MAMPPFGLYSPISRNFNFESLVTEIRSTLRVAYRAGDGSATILRSMLPKSRRVKLTLGKR